MEKQKRNFTDTILVGYLLIVMLMTAGQLLGQFIIWIPLNWYSDIGYTAYMYASFIGIWMVVLGYMALVKKNRPLIKALGPKEKGNTWKWFLLGLLIGFGLNGICVFVAWLHQDIFLSYDSFQPLGFFLILLAVFIQSSAEEVLCRGFLYQRLRKSYQNPWVAIIANALLFALLHLLNPGITVLSVLNIFIVGVFFSLLVYYYDSLWCAMAVHTAWNFTQNIVFGLPNSGQVVPFSVWKLDASVARDSFAYNVGFGIEGTIFADVILLLACVVVFLLGERKKKAQSVAVE